MTTILVQTFCKFTIFNVFLLIFLVSRLSKAKIFLTYSIDNSKTTLFGQFSIWEYSEISTTMYHGIFEKLIMPNAPCSVVSLKHENNNDCIISVFDLQNFIQKYTLIRNLEILQEICLICNPTKRLSLPVSYNKSTPIKL